MTGVLHNPVDDTRGNAKTLLRIRGEYELKIDLG